MKKLFTVLSLLFVQLSISQTENSLLWKISGNGLEKDSYLFGTMHVSERIAFHLDDIFYESLLSSDYVALESNPENWLDFSLNSGELTTLMNRRNNISGGNFYNKHFPFNLPKMNQIAMLLSNEHFFLNNILYRTDPMRQDFQEETYLDMFIFQSGSKFDKKVVGLEDIERSSDLVKKAVKESYSKESKALWLQKLMKEKDYNSLMSDAYRDRNISFLDSLNTGFYSDKYLENMLYIRNEDMVKGIDSLAKKGSVFSAIGAAHLAGEKGVIQKLKDRGYTVTPLTSDITEKAKDIKEKIENKEAAVHYEKRKSSDDFFSVKLPSKLYEIGAENFTICISPDIGNAAYHTVMRINTLHEFGGEVTTLQDINRILFEKIPGKIISKKDIVKNKYKGFDIVNQTKVGDYQRYQIFITPLEVIIFKMGGKRDYVLKRSDVFFDSIELLNKESEELVMVSPKYQGFEILMPQNHIFFNKEKIGTKLIQGVDDKGDYYFLKEVVLNDTYYIEEDDFELERIHHRFYKNMKETFDAGAFVGKGKRRSYVSNSKVNEEGKYIYLKTVIRGGHYYLMGKVQASEKMPHKYFDSFKTTDFTYDIKKLKIRKDTSLQYSVKTWVKPPKEESNYFQNTKKEYESHSKSSDYKAETNEEISVSFTKFHDWEYYESIDTLWKIQERAFKSISSLDVQLYQIISEENTNPLPRIKRLLITDKEKGKDTFGNEYISFLRKDSLSNKAVKIKKVFSKGRLYTLSTLIDVRYEESDFVKEFFNSFKPDSIEEPKNSLFEDKIDIFLKALKNGDSIAIKSYSEISFEKKHTDLLIDLLKKDSFTSNQQVIKGYLIRQLIKFKTKKVTKFIDQLYEDSFEDPKSQIRIFESYAKDKNTRSIKKLKTLLETDTPITNRSYDINNMFRKLNDSLPLAKELFPELLTYTSIDDYKKPIYSLLSDLLDENLIKGKEYKKYKNQILTEARIELKRQLSSTMQKNEYEFEGIISNSNGYYNQQTIESDLLQLYIQLLAPYIKEPKVEKFFSRISSIDNIDIKVVYATQLIKAKQKVSRELIEVLMKDLKGRYQFLVNLKKIKKLNIIPSEYLTKEKVYEAAILHNQKIGKKDSVVFVEKKDILVKNLEFEVFFYKVKTPPKYQYGDSSWKLYYAVYKKSAKEIQLKSFYRRFNQYIDETEPLEKQLEIHLEKIKHRNRQRVNLSTQKTNNYGLY